MVLVPTTAQVLASLPPFRRNRIWFPAVKLPRFVGHAQGISGHVGPDGVTLYASVSNFPRGWGALLINSDNGKREDANANRFATMALPYARHPGGIAIVGDTLVVPFEHDHQVAWLGYFDLRPDRFAPSAVAELALSPPPRYRPKRSAFGAGSMTGDRSKASAVGAAMIGETLWVAVVSENRLLRFVTRAPGRAPAQIAAVDTADPGVWSDQRPDWPDGLVDALGLLSDRAGNLYLLALATTNRLAHVGRGTEQIFLYRVYWAEQRITLELVESRTVRLPSPNTRFDLIRPSFRWGGGAMVDQAGQLTVLAIEPLGSDDDKSQRVDYLEFVHSSDNLDWIDHPDHIADARATPDT